MCIAGRPYINRDPKHLTEEAKGSYADLRLRTLARFLVAPGPLLYLPRCRGDDAFLVRLVRRAGGGPTHKEQDVRVLNRDPLV